MYIKFYTERHGKARHGVFIERLVCGIGYIAERRKQGKIAAQILVDGKVQQKVCWKLRYVASIGVPHGLVTRRQNRRPAAPAQVERKVDRMLRHIRQAFFRFPRVSVTEQVRAHILVRGDRFERTKRAGTKRYIKRYLCVEPEEGRLAHIVRPPHRIAAHRPMDRIACPLGKHRAIQRKKPVRVGRAQIRPPAVLRLERGVTGKITAGLPVEVFKIGELETAEIIVFKRQRLGRAQGKAQLGNGRGEQVVAAAEHNLERRDDKECGERRYFAGNVNPAVLPRMRPHRVGIHIHKPPVTAGTQRKGCMGKPAPAVNRRN